ncbi:hypothetical protein AJ78_06881 [Emergomyces pasteurianus Ep9510]|uniref:Uncharacterized protein n=1 Tax=Emergomyces pasteurianus Ep9510 TaxID=1447872 RepID=A0A1J9P9F2_9EURO|nr:hypothetical protein AJ78_06881 [Emergomyces pasteurianus Ep9510]
MGKLQETSTQAEDAKAPSDTAAPTLPALGKAESNNYSSESQRPKCHCTVAKTAISKSDVIIRRLDKFASTANGQERLLAMLQYNSQIIHYLLRSPPFQSISARLCAVLLPSATAAGTGGLPKKQPKTTPALLALSSLMSETRTTLRLFGLLSYWSWGSATFKTPPTDPILRSIAYTQVTAIVFYQILENVAHLTSKGVLSRRLVERVGSVGKWYLWSTRAWLGYVVLEFVRVWRGYVLSRERRRQKCGDREIGRESGEEEDVARRAEERGWKKSLVNNLAWLPLCLHWSFEDGFGVPDRLVGVLSMTAGAWGIHDMWNATAGVV